MKNRVTGTLRVAACAAVVCLGLEGVAIAQSFENVFGPPDAVDAGARRVTPVTFCPGEGFVAIGTTIPPAGSGTSDIYFVRTRADGSRVWELKYDVAPNGNDRGQALAEARDGSGFVLGGTTNVGADGDDLVLIKVDCQGELKWAYRYKSARGETLSDLVEARTGDPAFGTGPGDILVAGMTANPALNRDAMLLRVRNNGRLLWNRRYDLGGASEAFLGLTEARSSGGTTTGDVVAAGMSNATGSLQGFALRVNGNTGLFTAGNHIGALYGGPNQERFDSVVELRLGPAANSLVFIGSTYSAATASDIYLARSQPNPAIAMAQRRIGAPATTPLGDEAALDGKEMRFGLPFAPAGTLALTGRVGRPGTPAADAFLLAAHPSSLMPLIDTGRLFGDHGDGREWGVSISDHVSGLVIGGYSESNLEGAFPADPRDLYLVGTDENGKTNCAEGWGAPHVTVQMPVGRVMPATARFLEQTGVDVRVDKLDTLVEHCP